jgi:hypothetical protein
MLSSSLSVCGVVRKYVFQLAVFWELLVPLHLWAQVDSASISGSVVDKSDASIPEATVRTHNTATGTDRTNSTNRAGAFNFPGLTPGRYELTISKQGFSETKLEDIVLNVGDQKNVQIRLKVGTSMEVVVDTSSTTLNTTDATVGTVIDRKFVENIPLNGRSFQDLISMTPGVVTQSPQAGSSLGSNGDFSVNGQRTESNYYTVDGVSANGNAGSGAGYPGPGTSGALASSTALGTTQSLISVDALQEFRVQGSTYSAEYGRSPGGQFSLATRSGINQFHGTAFDYLRNNFFDANDWFNDYYGRPAPALRQNDFGGTLGGPVWLPHIYNGTNKTFFFISYEGLRLVQPQAATVQYVPDASLRQTAAAALKPILNAFPLPSVGGIDYPSGLAQFIQSYSLPSTINSTSVRIDHVLSSKISLFFRYSDTPSSANSRSLSSVTTSQNNNATYTAGATAHLSNSLNNEFRLGYLRTDARQDGNLDSFGGAQPINLSQAMGVDGYGNAYPVVVLYVPSVGISELSINNTSNRLRQWNAVDAFSLTLGHHQIKFGLDYLRTKSPIAPYNPIAEAEFYNSTSLLPSIQSNQAAFLSLSNTLGATPITNETAGFVQDQWSVRPTVSISTGLRWEVDPAPTGANGNDGYTVAGSFADPSSLSIAPQGTPLFKTTWYNFAPRLGIAWQAHQNPGWETIVRTGGGVFFDTDNRLATSAFQGVGFQASGFYSNAPIPVTSAELQTLVPSSIAAPYTNSSVYAFPTHMQLPYTLQWNASVQQSLGKAQAVTMSYVAANGRRLIGQQEINLEPYNPNFGYVYYYVANLTSNYQALEMQFQRTVSHGLQALASYTWSHSIDFGSSDPDITLQRGNSDFDVKHNFQGGITWDLPSLRANRVAQYATGGWAFDGRLITRTGFPVTLSGNQLVDSTTGRIYYSNVIYNSANPVWLYGSQYPGGRMINGGPTVSPASAAFTIPTGSSVGNAPRNFVRGFGESQVNVAVRREFYLKDTLRLQFRAETFNALNHPNFGYVYPGLTNAQFGQATKMLNSSLGTMAAQYQQGGARSMQFALKLMF